MMKHVIRNIQGLLLGLVLLPLSLPGTASAAVSSRTVNEGGKDLVVIANDSLELTFELARGGRNRTLKCSVLSPRDWFALHQ